MRIIGGAARGRTLVAPRGDTTRPTSDRVREAIFNILANLPGQPAERVLDLYAGSGALGIEALSRGSRALCAVDKDPRVAAIIQKNFAALGREGEGKELRVVSADVPRALAQLAVKAVRFGLVFIDPPYASDEAARALAALERHAAELLTDDAAVVVEFDRRNPPPETLETLSRADVREYGDTRVAFYRRGGSP